MKIRPLKTFSFLLLAFIVPLALSWVLFHFHDRFSFKTTQHGTLVNPPFNVESLWGAQKKWQIILVSDNQCDKDCEKTFHLLNQVKKALGKNSPRVVVEKKLPDTKVFIQKDFVMQHKIYLVDPLGNLFMYYADTTDPMNVLKDLKRVLEVSQIG